MSFKISLILIISALFCFLGVDFALAFGISPSRIWNDHLIPGAHFEQTVILTQASPKKPLDIKVEIVAPDIESWLTIEPGEKFTIPTGRQQFPMKVTIDVPEDAAYETYRGEIIVTAFTGEGKGQVTILSGGVTKLLLRVSGEEFADFKIRKLRVPNIEEGEPIKVIMDMENVGNVKIRPSRVEVEIYDAYRKALLDSGQATEMNFIEPFEKGRVIGKMITKLGIGEYWAVINVYKNDELVLKDERHFYVVEKGTLGQFLGLSLWIWALIGGIILAGFLSIKLGLFKKVLAKLGVSIKVEKIKKRR